MAAHSTIADQMSRVPPAVTEAIREGIAVPEPKLAALSAFTDTLLGTRGLPSTAEVQAFLARSYTERQVLELILAIGVKTLSNYANHLLRTPLDAIFASHGWEEVAVMEGVRS